MVRNRTLGHFKIQRETWSVDQVRQHMKDHTIMEYKPFGFVSMNGDELSVCIMPEFQKRGIATRMIMGVVRQHKTPLFVTIQIGNTGSFALFKKVSELANMLKT